jgi:hypothetical protein
MPQRGMAMTQGLGKRLTTWAWECFRRKPGLVALWVAAVSPVATLVAIGLVCSARDCPPLAILPVTLPSLVCACVGWVALRDGRRRHHQPSAVAGGVTLGWGLLQFVLVAAFFLPFLLIAAVLGPGF